MKRIITKTMVAALIISSMPMHAGFGQSLQNGSRAVLQGIGENAGVVMSGCTAIAALLMLGVWNDVYTQCEDSIEENKALLQRPSLSQEDKISYETKIRSNERRLKSLNTRFPVTAALVVALASASGYYFAKICGWTGSKI